MAIEVVEVPDFIRENPRYDTRYKRTAKWDPSIRDFARDGANRMLECTGEQGYMIWCYKIAQTERYACLGYDGDIGVEMEQTKGDDRESIVESMIERTITDALKVNPRTESVGEFEFNWNADEVHCTFLVKGIEWEKYFRITI